MLDSVVAVQFWHGRHCGSNDYKAGACNHAGTCLVKVGCRRGLRALFCPLLGEKVSVRLSIILIESLTFFRVVPIIEYIHDDPFNSRRCYAIIYYFFSILCFADDFNAPLYLHHCDVTITTQTNTVTNLYERPVFCNLFNRRINILSDVTF